MKKLNVDENAQNMLADLRRRMMFLTTWLKFTAMAQDARALRRALRKVEHVFERQQEQITRLRKRRRLLNNSMRRACKEDRKLLEFKDRVIESLDAEIDALRHSLHAAEARHTGGLQLAAPDVTRRTGDLKN